jgi:hypothetical protein
MPYHEITFENMIASYSKVIAYKYKDSWGVHASIKNQHEDYIRGCLCGIHKAVQKQFVQFIIKRFEEFKIHIQNVFTVSIHETNDVYSHNDVDIICIEDDNIKIKMHCLDGWKEYKTVVVEQTMHMIGILIHNYGVDSRKHNEASLIDENLQCVMFQAMIYENMLEQLYALETKHPLAQHFNI